MKANDVLTLANKAGVVRRRMHFYYMEISTAKQQGNLEKMQLSESRFLQLKHEFSTILDCIAIVSRDAGNEFRAEGYGRDDF